MIKKITKHFDCGKFARSLIALLFVLAGIMKIFAISKMGLAGASVMLTPLHLPSSLLPFVLIAVIFIEVVVASAYAIGYKWVKSGWVLIAFTALATIFYHNPATSNDPSAAIMALKNIAIIGGILATIGCYCGKCECMTCKVQA